MATQFCCRVIITYTYFPASPSHQRTALTRVLVSAGRSDEGYTCQDEEDELPTVDEGHNYSYGRSTQCAGSQTQC